MRDTNNWKKDVKNELEKYIKEGSNLKAGKICDIELGLYLWEKISAEESCESLWVLLAGYYFNSEDFNTLSDELKTAIAGARFYLKYFKSKQLWKNNMLEYMKIKQNLRLYDLEENTFKLIKRQPTICPDRERAYEKALQEAPKHNIKTLRWAKDGKVFFTANKVQENFDMPVSFGKLADENENIVKLEVNRNKKPITIKLSELLSTAKYMDKKLKYGSWEQRIERITILMPNRDEKFEKTGEFTLDGVFNMVGMVSSGKSTLMQILAVWSALKGYHITLIVDSVAAVMDMVELMEKLQIEAVPILGASNRDRHLEKLHFIRQQESFNQLENEETFSWLSTVCPLDGLRKDTTVNDPFKPGTEPCNRLYKEDEKEPYLCPVYYNCPVHKAWNSLKNARILVATPASLIYTWVPIQNGKEDIKVFELVYNLSDIIVFDEADRVQLLMDSFFSPSQVLADGNDTAWLNKLGDVVESAFYSSGRRQLKHQSLEEWLQAYRNVQSAVNRLYTILNTSEKIRRWAALEHFSAQWLIIRFVETLEDKSEKEKESIQEDLFLFREDPMGMENDSLLSEAWGCISTNSRSSMKFKRIKEWCKELELSENSTENIYDKIEFIIVTSVLEKNLKVIIDEWDEAEEAFNIGNEEVSFFKNYLRDFTPIIPESPMGNYFGFMFEEGRKDNPGKLQVFRFMGIGRWLLCNFPNILKSLDDIQGPHTLLLSGTSWAPKSSTYHLQLPVKAILKAPDSEFEAIEKSEFIFKPAYYENEPIRVSGQEDKNKRLNSLKRIIDYLTKEETELLNNGLSILEKELEKLQQEEKQLLLLTGSYEEAEVVQEYLAEKMKRKVHWKEEYIYRLVSDEEDIDTSNLYTIKRGVLKDFAGKNAKILIAPLLAIERGHNILNENNVAALGSAFFLVRPMPAPNDMKNNTVYINNWALNKLTDTKWIYKIGNKPSIGAIGSEFRKMAEKQWRYRMKKMISHKGGTKTMEKEELEELYWTQLVLIWQVIGRLIRGGQSARVYFVDAAFAIENAKGTGKETSKTSMLLGIKEALKVYFTEEQNGINDLDKEIAEALYEPFYKALINLRGLN